MATQPTRHQLAAALALALLSSGHCADAAEPSPPTKVPTKVPLAERVTILKQSYPDVVYSITNNTLRLINNRTLVIDDGAVRRHMQRLRDSDIADQLAQVYPIGKCYRGRERDLDAGQLRNEAFFRHAYGANEHQVSRETETIDWFGTRVRFSPRNGAAEALKRVRADLSLLPREAHSVVASPARDFAWSEMPGRAQLDVHSFGIAIDINPAYSERWQLLRGKSGRLTRYQNRIPDAVVAIFERHGFIWGGKWFRFETGHFEYRPEMIAIGKLAEQRGCEGLK